MATVRQMLTGKGAEVFTIAPDTTVIDALRLMAEKNVGALVIVEGEAIAGIFSERDYARKIVLQGRSSYTTPVSEIMTGHVYTVAPDVPAEECMVIMTDKHIRHLPVVEDGRLAGIISIGDVVKNIITEQQVMIKHLENYIQS